MTCTILNQDCITLKYDYCFKMARKKKKVKETTADEKVIYILQTDVNNGVVEELKKGNGDESLHKALLEYKVELDEKGIEIFRVYDYFMVGEDGIYIALYEDEMREL